MWKSVVGLQQLRHQLDIFSKASTVYGGRRGNGLWPGGMESVCKIPLRFAEEGRGGRRTPLAALRTALSSFPPPAKGWASPTSLPRVKGPSVPLFRKELGRK